MDCDFPNVEDNKFELLPAGAYLCKVAGIEEKVAKSSGNPNWEITLKVLNGIYKGVNIIDYWYFSDKAMPRTKLVCKRLGIPVDKRIDLQPSMVINKVAIITVSQEWATDKDGTRKHNQAGENYMINKIPYAGYAVYEGVAPEQKKEEEPF